MSPHLKSIDEVVPFLLAYSPEKLGGETYTLERNIRFMELLGNPQNQLKVIHIAGTSGKTSTAYYIRALLEARGLRTGLTASPHIMSVTERVQIGGVPLPDEKFVSYLNQFLEIISQWPDVKPTYFELLVAFAYWVFVKEKVDYAVVEVGLGGTLDATNTVTRQDKICVLTPIGLDHTQILGETIAAIADQKAGIIGMNQDVFSANQVSDAQNVIAARVQSQHAVLHVGKSKLEKLNLPPFQQQNLQLALSVTDFVADRDGLPKVSDDDVSKSAKMSPPGRFEKFEIGSKTVILDGAHNPQKLTALLDTLHQYNIDNASWLVSFVDAPDEKIDDCFKIIANERLDKLTVTQFLSNQDAKGRKSVPLAELQKKARHYGIEAEGLEDAAQALSRLLKEPASTIIVTGSLFLVSALRPIIIGYLDSQS